MVKNKITVLSLFDGISCGKIALERAGIEIGDYYASEIDKYSISISQKNYPDIIQLGDIEKWKEWKLPKIDIIIGGSPCQGFSIAGDGLNFNDPRSKLFFVYAEILKELNPKYFLLENVKMKKEWQDIITRYLGVSPIKINSALVSAQNRERLYWTNISNDIKQPEDLGLCIADVLEKDIIDTKQKYGKIIVTGRATDINGHDILKRIYSQSGKSPTLNSMRGGNRHPKIDIRGAAIRNQVTKDGIQKQLNIRKDNKSNCVVPSYSEKLNGVVNGVDYRPLTPLECERLQTLPDNYTDGVSNSRRYSGIGNGWTVDVIAHIFSYLK